MPTKADISSLRKQFRTLLQMNRHRVTPERMIVLDEICTMQTHFDVDDIVERISGSTASISRATVYRTVELLEKYGLIRKARLIEMKSYYELTAGRHHHEHMICTSCGKIIEFESKGIETIQDTICRHHHFTMTYHFLHIFGVCGDCKKE